MRFVETPVFTLAIADALPDLEYSALQHALICRPELGVVIPGSGGIRKLRWRVANRGKRGGLRIVYFWEGPAEVFYMLFAYSKSERADLSAAQLRVLKRLVAEEFS